MPTLDWTGKRAVLNHHKQVPYRLLECAPKLSTGDPPAAMYLPVRFSPKCRRTAGRRSFTARAADWEGSD